MTQVEAAEELPFDEVILVVADAERRLTPREFFAMSLPLRLRHVIARTARFLRGGAEIDAQLVLAQVRTLRVAS